MSNVQYVYTITDSEDGSGADIKLTCHRVSDGLELPLLSPEVQLDTPAGRIATAFSLQLQELEMRYLALSSAYDHFMH